MPIPNKDFFDSYAEAVLITTADKRALYANSAFNRLTGFTEKDLSVLTLEEIMAKESLAGMGWANPGTIRISHSPIILADSSVGRVYTLIEQRPSAQMEEAKNEIVNLTGQLKKLNEDFDQFIYATSHDLQEPLRTIGSYIQLINKNMEKGNYEVSKDFMNYVLSGVLRMQQLINDLLQFSRVNRKGSPFTYVNMDEVVSISLTHLSKTIRENDAQIIADKLPGLTGDTFQLIRLFQNLIDNAIKFKAKGRKPEVHITVKENKDNYLFAFKDNGIGVETKFYNRIFAVFQKLHNGSEYSGTGMGLAVCKKIVDRHGGEIWVESETGTGSTFYFTLKK